MLIHITKQSLPLSLLLSAFIFLQGCDNPNTNNRQLGTVLGSVGGAVIGSNIAGKNNRGLGTVIGAVTGGFLGNQIGKDIDKANRKRINYILSTQRSNEPFSWQDPDNQASFVMTTSPAYKYNERICRPYKIVMYINGKKGVQQGIACRVSPEEWEIVE